MSEPSGSVAQEDEAYVRTAEKMRGCWVGPFPILKFLGLLSDHSELDPPPLSPPDIFSMIPVEESNGMNLSLITAFESLGLEKLHFKNTGDHSNPSPPPYKKCRPDISVCSSDTKFGDLRDPTYASEARASPACFSELVFSFELERGECDPFSDKPNGLDPCFENAHTEVQGRIAAILNEMLCFTWRTHAFSVFMDGHIARLFRADRAGVLASEAFDYRKNPEHLTGFLCYPNNMRPNQWGFDFTFDHNHKVILVPSFDHSESQYIKVELEDGEELTHTAKLLVGSGRRVVRVRDQISNEPYIMKDGWRPEIPDKPTEWGILSELNQKQVSHIPTFLFGGDIEGQKYHRTLADRFAGSDWRIGPLAELTPRTHYRYIESDVGEPLEDFSDARELACILRDVIQALRDAWVKCRYLHRDVSSANILITPPGEGVLIDWEFAKKYSEGEEPWVQASGRIGTWNYMSVAILQNWNRPHSFLDDLQSVYWVGVENALNSLEHDSADNLLPTVALCLVEYRAILNDGGVVKEVFLRRKDFIKFSGNPTFSSLMHDFCKMMDSACHWQFELTRNLEAQCPTDVPDYDKVLQRFKDALDDPEGEWSSKPCNNKNQLRPIMDAIVRTQFSGPPDLLVDRRKSSQSSELTLPESYWSQKSS